MENIKRINKTVSLENSFQDLLSIVHKIKPQWNFKDIEQNTFDDGITNKMLGFYHCGDKSTMILARIYGKGTDLFLDREEEIKHFELLHSYGCAPSLYCVFNNGICYEYIQGNTLSKENIRLPSIYKPLTRELARMHSIPSIGDAPSCPKLFPTIRRFLDLAFSSNSSERSDKEMRLRNEVDELELHLTKLKSPVVFCHNDILLHNVIFNPETDVVKFIDYEYAGFNYQAYDIGNHFCEFAGVEETDYNLYPNKSFQIEWLRCYLEAWNKDVDKSNLDDKIEKLYKQVNKFALAAHLLWGVWALVQACYSQIDFDYEGYSKLRLDEYYKRKTEFLSL